MKDFLPKPNKSLFPLIIIGAIASSFLTDPLDILQGNLPELDSTIALYFFSAGILIALLGFNYPKRDD